LTSRFRFQIAAGGVERGISAIAAACLFGANKIVGQRAAKAACCPILIA
jgi:hypothetical protein